MSKGHKNGGGGKKLSRDERRRQTLDAMNGKRVPVEQASSGPEVKDEQLPTSVEVERAAGTLTQDIEREVATPIVGAGNPDANSEETAALEAQKKRLFTFAAEVTNAARAAAEGDAAKIAATTGSLPPQDRAAIETAVNEPPAETETSPYEGGWTFTHDKTCIYARRQLSDGATLRVVYDIVRGPAHDATEYCPAHANVAANFPPDLAKDREHILEAATRACNQDALVGDWIDAIEERQARKQPQGTTQADASHARNEKPGEAVAPQAAETRELTEKYPPEQWAYQGGKHGGKLVFRAPGQGEIRVSISRTSISRTDKSDVPSFACDGPIEIFAEGKGTRELIGQARKEMATAASNALDYMFRFKLGPYAFVEELSGDNKATLDERLQRIKRGRGGTGAVSGGGERRRSETENLSGVWTFEKAMREGDKENQFYAHFQESGHKMRTTLYVNEGGRVGFGNIYIDNHQLEKHGAEYNQVLAVVQRAAEEALASNEYPFDTLDDKYKPVAGSQGAVGERDTSESEGAVGGTRLKTGASAVGRTPDDRQTSSGVPAAESTSGIHFHVQGDLIMPGAAVGSQNRVTGGTESAAEILRALAAGGDKSETNKEHRPSSSPETKPAAPGEPKPRREDHETKGSGQWLAIGNTELLYRLPGGREVEVDLQYDKARGEYVCVAMRGFDGRDVGPGKELTLSADEQSRVEKLLDTELEQRKAEHKVPFDKHEESKGSRRGGRGKKDEGAKSRKGTRSKKAGASSGGGMALKSGTLQRIGKRGQYDIYEAETVGGQRATWRARNGRVVGEVEIVE